ncbi:coiled-coil alpha-helical rod protein, putative [Perkinsus marinus ATCC 50983]|uniref:Coiled-coil alpha-helical rod protein, putative n=1 Tax=Perkinsus marinus (strain ATCC 50983 / TXsc) TaxID=423536 RepID=C5LGQ7_PERM5|nr:coiled-coil alpha-helical rod protein, putative [Perkinsus marinus ATCC 50983]EER04102.1 coiled-coil alpha-helical rod protein, putative [Perkinsus marinus ATCC 50983]|eukprot:XP_002772286.1 coiled-coil alpha-helical rod protein, putative [Perkinsus marinus ATCC 50983]
MSKKLEAEVKHLEGDLSAALGKLNNLETQARADRDGYEEKLKSYGKEIERLVRSIEEMKGGGEMATLQKELRTASESLEEVKRMAAEDKAEHQKNQEERDKEILTLKESIGILERSTSEAKAALEEEDQIKINEERDGTDLPWEFSKVNFHHCVKPLVGQEGELPSDILKEGRIRLIFHRARSLPSTLTSSVVLAKLLRVRDSKVLHACSTLRCAVDSWEGHCDINEELAHVLARSEPNDKGKDADINRILNSKSLPDAVTAAVIATHPSGEVGTPEPDFYNFYYDQSQTLTIFLKETFTDPQRSGISEALVCMTPGSVGTSVAPNWRGSVIRMILSSPGSQRTLKLHASRSESQHREKPSSSRVEGGHATVEAVLAIARDREEVNAHLAREYARRAENLEKASADVNSLTKQLEAIRRENEQLRDRMREERGMWDDASKKAKSNTSTDPVLEAALKSLSSQQIVARLQETLMKYRNERATVDELHRRLQAAGTEIAKAQRDRQRLEELEKIHVEQAEYYQKLIEKSAKLPKYEATIKSQTKIIAKLETVLEESLKKAGKSTKMLSELTRLKAANDTLRAEIQALKAKFVVTTE